MIHTSKNPYWNNHIDGTSGTASPASDADLIATMERMWLECLKNPPERDYILVSTKRTIRSAGRWRGKRYAYYKSPYELIRKLA